MRRFEFVEGSSNKFWEIDRTGSKLTIRFGKVGAKGQTQLKSLATEKDAEAELQKLVKEKVRKGYVEKSDNAIDTPDAPAEAAPAPATVSTKATKAKPATTKATPEPEPGWVDAGNGYFLSLREGKLVCRKGSQTLASVPKPVKEGDVADRLIMLKEWLDRHAQECRATVETWMLRTLAVPRAALEAVWKDDAWRAVLENLVVVPLNGDGSGEVLSAGFFRGVSERGIGLVNLDGETIWVNADRIAIPHPVLIPELDELRTLATELSLKQGVSQLFRETFKVDKQVAADAMAIGTYQNGKFQQLNHCLGQCRKLGYRVKGGSAVVRVWEQGKVFEARYWVGSDDPTCEAWTGELVWVDESEQAMAVGKVPPVAFSEGMRMAAGIYAARKVEEEVANG